jgi:hypothetical protein
VALLQVDEVVQFETKFRYKPSHMNVTATALPVLRKAYFNASPNRVLNYLLDCLQDDKNTLAYHCCCPAITGAAKRGVSIESTSLSSNVTNVLDFKLRRQNTDSDTGYYRSSQVTAIHISEVKKPTHHLH